MPTLRHNSVVIENSLILNIFVLTVDKQYINNIMCLYVLSSLQFPHTQLSVRLYL
jgi:hypothetical protein